MHIYTEISGIINSCHVKLIFQSELNTTEKGKPDCKLCNVER